ncbi:hypothetical protein PSEUDO8AS_100095 [Pseudomonas sp. 8AS]|nr:hypothetical protein PSEUDO8AS_100095 [Pseudomonas sp. 8AS]
MGVRVSPGAPATSFQPSSEAPETLPKNLSQRPGKSHESERFAGLGKPPFVS